MKITILLSIIFISFLFVQATKINAENEQYKYKDEENYDNVRKYDEPSGGDTEKTSYYHHHPGNNNHYHHHNKTNITRILTQIWASANETITALYSLKKQYNTLKYLEKSLQDISNRYKLCNKHW